MDKDCVLCSPAPQQACEAYTYIEVLDRGRAPAGGDPLDFSAEIPVCLQHYQVIEDAIVEER